jgi:uracil DNA glycosylase
MNSPPQKKRLLKTAKAVSHPSPESASRKIKECVPLKKKNRI